MELARKRLWAAWALLAALQVAYTITASVEDGRLNAVFQHGDYTDSSSSSTSSDGSVVLFFVTLLVNCRTYVLFSVVVSNLSCILSLVILLGKDLFKSSLTYGFRVGAAVGGAAMQFVVMLFIGEQIEVVVRLFNAEPTFWTITHGKSALQGTRVLAYMVGSWSLVWAAVLTWHRESAFPDRESRGLLPVTDRGQSSSSAAPYVSAPAHTFNAPEGAYTPPMATAEVHPTDINRNPWS
jgi:hypothetical protein